MLYVLLLTMLAVKFVAIRLTIYVHCMSSRVRIGDKSEVVHT